MKLSTELVQSTPIRKKRMRQHNFAKISSIRKIRNRHEIKSANAIPVFTMHRQLYILGKIVFSKEYHKKKGCATQWYYLLQERKDSFKDFYLFQ